MFRSPPDYTSYVSAISLVVSLNTLFAILLVWVAFAKLCSFRNSFSLRHFKTVFSLAEATWNSSSLQYTSPATCVFYNKKHFQVATLYLVMLLMFVRK